MTRAEYITGVREQLATLGLPMNWQPEDRSIIALHAMNKSLEDCVKFFEPNVKFYEKYVNKKESVDEEVRPIVASD